MDSQLSRHNFVVKSQKLMCLSIYQLLHHFCETGSTSADDFLEYATKVMSRDVCRMTEKVTRSQSNTSTWHKLRYGRVIALRVYEAAYCKTFDGSFVQQIIGASKIFDSQTMERGKRLEKEVLLEVTKMTGLRFQDCGLLLLPSFPVLEASPDASGDYIIVEVKRPSTSKTFHDFLPSGKVNKKCKAQMNMQMFASGKRRGLFCVADPKFETSKQVTIVWENYNEDFTNCMIENAIVLWKNHIFPKLMYRSS